MKRILFFLGIIFPLFWPAAIEATAINWQKNIVSQVPIYPLDGDCYRFYQQAPLLFPASSSGDLWLAVRSINLTATTSNHQIDIDIFEPSGGYASLPDDPPNILPNFLTIRYRGEPFIINYDPGLLIYPGSAKVKIVDGGSWCLNFNESSPILVSYEVEYAFITSSQADNLNEWFWSDPIPSGIGADGWQIKGIFESSSAGKIINLKGLYAYSTVPLTLSFVLQENAFIEQEYWSTAQGDDRVRFYQPALAGKNPESDFRVINHTGGELPSYARIFIHAWGKRDSGLKTIIASYHQASAMDQNNDQLINGLDFAVF